MRPGRFLRRVVALSSGALAAACTEITTTAPIAVTITTDSGASALPRSIADGELHHVMVRLADANGAGVHSDRVIWSSSDTTAIAIRPGTMCGGPAASTASAESHACLSAKSGGVATITVHVGQEGFTTTDLTFSVRVNERWTDVAASGHSTCAINFRGKLYCWGSGELTGMGTATTASLPTAVPTMQSLPVSQLFAGGGTGCVTARGSTVPFCWGLNSTGQAGLGASVNYAPFPTLPLGNAFSSVSPGTFFSCGIVAVSRHVSCWGLLRNRSLALSFLDPIGDSQPCAYLTSLGARCVYTAGGFLALVVDMAPDSATTVSSGVLHACATTISSVQCWGDNTVGQVGKGVVSDSTFPVRLFALAKGDTATVASGDYHACATLGPVAKSDRPTYCWGQNDKLQTGTSACATSAPRIFPLTNVCANPSPVRIAVDFASVVSGAGHSCGLSSAGVASCWGDNSEGMLGRGGPATPSATVAAVPLDSGRTFYKITSGSEHVCGITRVEGAIFCWGWNAYGQVGDGSTLSRPTPVRLREPPTILTTLGRLSR